MSFAFIFIYDAFAFFVHATCLSMNKSEHNGFMNSNCHYSIVFIILINGKIDSMLFFDALALYGIWINFHEAFVFPTRHIFAHKNKIHNAKNTQATPQYSPNGIVFSKPTTGFECLTFYTLNSFVEMFGVMLCKHYFLIWFDIR